MLHQVTPLTTTSIFLTSSVVRELYTTAMVLFCDAPVYDADAIEVNASDDALEGVVQKA